MDKSERILKVATELNARPRMTLAEITQTETIQCLLFDPEPIVATTACFPRTPTGRLTRPTRVRRGTTTGASGKCAGTQRRCPQRIADRDSFSSSVRCRHGKWRV